jgi:hypothetical protein
MTDQTNQQPTGQPAEPAAAPPPDAPDGPGGPPAEPALERTFEERMQGFGREASAAGERLGREAQAAGERWSRDPSVVDAADTAARVWGLLVLGVGLWFFADVTLGLDMPAVAWRDVWPVALIVIGLAVVLRGMARRRT